MGMELQITLWAYAQPTGTLGQIVFKRYRLINKGGWTVNDMYLCQWSDPDIGTYTDDLAGLEDFLRARATESSLDTSAHLR